MKALGRPASLDHLLTDNTFAATLLSLRELMHHPQFDDVTVLHFFILQNQPAQQAQTR